MKKNIFPALLLSVIMAVNVYAAEISTQRLETITTSPGALTSDASMDVTLEGTVLTEVPADVITVLMPTQVYFHLLPDEEEWNKVLSPVNSVSNLSASDVKISITRANAEGADLTVQRPEDNEVRLASPLKTTSANLC